MTRSPTATSSVRTSSARSRLDSSRFKHKGRIDGQDPGDVVEKVCAVHIAIGTFGSPSQAKSRWCAAAV